MATDTVLVSNVTGKAWIRTDDGTLTPLHEGMRIPANAHVITDAGSQVTLMASGVPPIIVGEGRDLVLSDDVTQTPDATGNAVTPPSDPAVAQILAALESGNDDIFNELEATAAVLSGGASGDGSNFVRLLSIVEATTPLDLAYPNGAPVPIEEIILSGDGGVLGIPAPTLTIFDYNNGDEGGPSATLGTFTISEDRTPPPPSNPSPVDNPVPQGVVSLMAVPQSSGGPGDPGNHEPAIGQFRFTASGLQNITFTFQGETNSPVGGTDQTTPETLVLTAQRLATLSEANPFEIDTDRGLMQLIGYNPNTGAISYRYWSDGAQDHNTETGDGESVFDTITVTINSDGGSVSGNIVANITDTVPEAVPDWARVREDSDLLASGNVITGQGEARADHLGIDATEVTGVRAGGAIDGDSDGVPDPVSGGVGTTIQGVYGDLTVYGDGHYTYALVNDPDDGRYDDVQALAKGDHPKDVFSYTLTDADGDQSTTTLTVTVKGTNDAPTITFGGIEGADANAAVSEEGLRGGLLPPHGPGIPDTEGSPDTTNSAKDGGTFTVHDVDAGDTMTVALGVPATSLTSGGQDVHWSVSGDGQTLTGQIGITLFGHFIPVADVIKVSLQNDGDGNYSYDVRLLAPIDHPNTSIEDALDLHVPILVTDNHGEQATDNVLTINIQDDSPLAVDDNGGTVVEDSHGLAAVLGGNVLLNDTGWGADGPNNLFDGFAWNTSDNAGTQADLSAYGKLTLGAAGGWTFVLDSSLPATQELADNQEKDFVLTYTLTDNDGDTSEASLTIQIRGTNDLPTITFGGSDGADANAAVSEEGLRGGLLPPHGPGIPDTEGSPDTTNSAKDGGTFTVHDVDAGDTMTVALGVPATSLTSGGQDVHWSVSGDGQTLTGRIGIMLFGHFIPVADVIKVSLQNDGDGNYSYDVRLLAPIDHPNTSIEDALDLHVPILVTDNHGAQAVDNVLTINIQDDSPLAVNDNGGTVVEDSHGLAAVLGGNVLLNDTGWGADGPNNLLNGFAWNTSDNAAVRDALSDYGTLHLDALGNWKFTLDSSEPATQELAAGQEKDFVLTYTLTDNDGDTSTAELTITIKGTNDDPTLTFINSGDDLVSVSEEGLPGTGHLDQGIPWAGNDAAGLTDTTNSTTAQGSFQVSDVDQGDILTVSLGDGVAAAQTNSGTGIGNGTEGAAVVLQSNGQDIHWKSEDGGHLLIGFIGDPAADPATHTSIIEVSLTETAAGSGSYTYTVDLKGPVDHPLTNDAAEDVISLTIPVTVSDNHGGSANSTITVRIEDDSPHVHDVTATATLTQTDAAPVDAIDFATNQGSWNADTHTMTFAGGITATAMGFNTADSLELSAAGIQQGANGLGVISTNEAYHVLPGEVDYRKIGDEGNSESLTIKLPDGKVAYGANVEFAMMFGNGENETGVVEFYRNGVLISTQEFSSDSTSGAANGHFIVSQIGGFDTMVFKATDDGASGHSDNSDFAVKSIDFSNVGAPVLASEGDVHFLYGADGPGGIVLTSINDVGLMSEGNPVKVDVADQHIEGRTEDGKLVFQLVLDSTGHWAYSQYQPLAGVGDNGTIDFSFKVFDADFDPKSGTISIGLPSVPTIDIPDNNEDAAGQLTIVEGTSSADLGTPTHFTIHADAGVSSITIQGKAGPETISLSDLQNLDTSPKVIETDRGTLTLTGYDDGTGNVTYTYSAGAQDHDQPDTDDAVLDSVLITVTDGAGQHSDGTLAVQITDTTPVAKDDAVTQDAENASVTVDVFADHGNGADTVGADGVDLTAGVTHTGAMNGTVAAAGTLTYNDDGTFTYMPGAGEEGTVTFDYTITDGDHDSSTATVTITLVGDSTPTITVNPTDPDAQDGTGLVHESGLDTGSDPGVGKTTTGTLDITTGGDTLGTVEIQGKDGLVDVTSGGTVEGAHGTLTVTLAGGVYSYSYTLTSATTDVDGAVESDDFTVKVTDSDGDPATATLTVEIVDDVPTISVDTAATGAYGLGVTGSVDMAFGADGEKGVAMTLGSETVAGVKDGSGNYTFTLGDGSMVSLDGSTGNFSYNGVPASGADTSYAFTFTVEDNDGDKASASTTATLTGTDTSGLSGVASSSDVDVAANTDGNPGNNVSHAVTVSGLPGGAQLVEGTYTATGGGYGQITVDASGNATYQQTSLYTHTDAGADTAANADSVTVTVKLGDGSTTDMVVKVAITDDVPTISVDTAATGAYGLGVTGSVDMAFGADGEKGVTMTLGSETVAGVKDGSGNYTFTLSDGSMVSLDGSTGNFSYNGVPASGAGTSYAFTFTVEDNDGDKASASTTATLTGTDTSGLSGVASSSDVDVAANTDGNPGNNVSHAVTVSGLPGGAQLVEGTYTATGGGYGQITVDASGNATYQQTSLYTHTDAGADTAANADSVTVTVKLGDGSTTDMVVKVAITDDVPTAQNHAAGTVTENDATTLVEGDVLGAGSGSGYGADGAATSGALAWGTAVATQGSSTVNLSDYGDLTQNTDGSWKFELNNANSATQALQDGDTINVTFSYTLKDADNDAVTRNVSFDIKGANDAPTIVVPDFPSLQGVNAVVTEEALTPRGIPDNTGNPDGDHSSSASFTGTITVGDPDTPVASLVLSLGDAVTAAQGPGSLSAPITDLESHGNAIQWDSQGDTLVGYTGTLNGGDYHEVITVQLAAGDTGASRGYTVTLHDTLDHPLNSMEDVIDLTIPVTVSDGGLTAGTTITVRIEDDMPQAVETAAVSTSATDIPDIYTGEVNFSGTGGVQNTYSFDDGAVHVTAQGFSSKNGLDLEHAPVYQGSGGLGVDSNHEPYFPIAGEVDYRKVNDDGASEVLSVSLTGGRVAYGATVEFDAMFSGEAERGIAIFYRNGVEIARQIFTSDADDGNYAKDFRVEQGGFDRIDFMALDNGKPASHEDNSDFAVTSINFLGSAEAQAIAYADGHIALGYGADGPGAVGLALTGAETGLTTADGRHITSTVSNNTILGKDSHGNLVYELRLTPADGHWEFYQYQAMDKTADGHIDFDYQLVDADGDGAPGHIGVIVDSAPTVTIPDGNGLDAGDLSVQEHGTSVDGNFTVTSHGSGLSITIEDTSDGSTHTVDLSTLSGGGTQTIALSNGSVMVLNGYDSQTGKVTYTYQSTEARDHTLGDDTVLDHIKITASDSGGTSSDTLDVQVTDTQPNLHAQEQTFAVGTGGTNVMLILDTSGSMDYGLNSNSKAKSGEPSRMDKLHEALDALFGQFQEQLDAGQQIRVNIVGFSSGSSNITDGWVDLAAARDAVDNLKASGNTNYDAALQEAMDQWKDTDSQLTGSDINNVSYFLSDGQPQSSTDWDGSGKTYKSSNGIDATEEAAWHQFLVDHGIDSYAVGMGNAAGLSNLQPIGYNGADSSDTSPHAFEVDFDKLADTIIQIAHGEADGNVIADGGGRIGADDVGAHIQSVTIDGHTYTYDFSDGAVAREDSAGPAPDSWSFNAGTGVLTVHTGEGVFTLDLAGSDIGDYNYTASAAGEQVVDYILVDGDGDSASATLTLNATEPVKPDAVDDHIITNILSDQITIDSAVLLANDERGTDPNPLNDVTVNTGWQLPGADFTQGTVQLINFTGTGNYAGNKSTTVDRSDFSKAQNGDYATVELNGYLAKANSSNGNNIDTITIALVAGEKLTLDHDLPSGHVSMEYKGPSGGWSSISDGSSFDATVDGNYQIRITNIDDNGYSSGGKNAESYHLTMTVDYSDVALATAEADYTISGAAGSDDAHITVSYQEGHTLQGDDGNNTLLAGDGNDTLNGGKGDDVLFGGKGDDILVGGDGNDVLIGGQGNDILTGGAGDDVFVWTLGDQGTTSTPAVDHITDFGTGGTDPHGKDTIDLSDLLQGEHGKLNPDGTPADGFNLTDYLHVEHDGSNTTINISTTGHISGGHDQQIVVEGTDLTSGLAADQQATMIANMINDGKLKVDQ